jgi:hypothetical protein
VTHRTYHPCSVRANNREIVFSERLCCERRERYNAQHSGRNCYPRGIRLVLLQFEAVRLVPHAMTENKQRRVRRIGSFHPYRSFQFFLPAA